MPRFGAGLRDYNLDPKWDRGQSGAAGYVLASGLIYFIFQEDLEPTAFNISFEQLHLRLQVWRLSQSGPFDSTHPIVVAHPNQWRLIERIWTDFRRRKPRALVQQQLPGINSDINWFKELKSWWESWKDADGNSSWRFKKPHATLVGPPNAGKTTAARYLCSGLRVFTPSGNKDFCLSGLNEDDFDVIVWDDFELSCCNRRTLLCLMQGDLCTIDVKCNNAYTITWQKPIIFTTNFTLQDEAYNARTITIIADISCIINN